MTKKINILGKTVPTIALALVVMAGLGSAALLTYYGQITATVNVEQAITLDGDIIYEIGNTTSGNTHTSDTYTLSNKAEVPVTVKFNTISVNSTGQDASDGITTTYRGVLNLTKKDTSTWQAIGQPITITYTLTGTSFVINEAPPTDYVFIYAMDKENRFQNYAQVMRVEDVDESLPMTGDWNADANPNYCDNNNGMGDYFTHCVGAKIWAVPETTIGSCVDNVCNLTWAGMVNYYWETDLITYTKTADNTIVLPANGGGFNFEVVNAFSPALINDTYTITTSVLPIV